MERAYDIALFGATGFVGELTAEYLAEHAPREARIALAGRNREKLEALRERLGRPDFGVIVADERPLPGYLGSFAVIFRKKSAADDRQLAFTSPYRVDNPTRGLSATPVDSWCGTLGLDCRYRRMGDQRGVSANDCLARSRRTGISHGRQYFHGAVQARQYRASGRRSLGAFRH